VLYNPRNSTNNEEVEEEEDERSNPTPTSAIIDKLKRSSVDIEIGISRIIFIISNPISINKHLVSS